MSKGPRAYAARFARRHRGAILCAKCNSCRWKRMARS